MSNPSPSDTIDLPVPQRYRLIASVWFAAVAALLSYLLIRSSCILCTNEIVLTDDDATIFWESILGGAISGYTIGGSILDLRRIKGPIRAALQGIAVALLGFFLFMVILSVYFFATEFHIDAVSQLLTSFAITSAIIIYSMVFAMLYAGWFLLIFGAGAGWLLWIVQFPFR